MIGYMIDAWGNGLMHPDIRVLDSRGPGHILLSPWFFARCLLTIAVMAPLRSIGQLVKVTSPLHQIAPS